MQDRTGDLRSIAKSVLTLFGTNPVLLIDRD
jgi:hypothetical protein